MAENTIHRFTLRADPRPLALGVMIELGGGMSVALNEDGSSRQAIAWPTHEEEMAALSEAYPLVTFTLAAETVEGTSGWSKRWKNGAKLQQGEIYE